RLGDRPPEQNGLNPRSYSARIRSTCTLVRPWGTTVTGLARDSFFAMKSAFCQAPFKTYAHAKMVYCPGATPRRVKFPASSVVATLYRDGFCRREDKGTR